MAHEFRFGYQLTTAEESDPVSAALRAESAGFDTFLVSDHVGPGLAPLPTLAAVATATTDIRLGTFVLNADMRNPVQLAWEASTIDHLSKGRFELGLGAGHTPHEYAETGIALHSAQSRKAALAERSEIVRRLLDGHAVDWAGTHHQLDGAHVDRSAQDRLPILIGGNGDQLLAHAGQHADIIGLQGLGKTREDGHRHSVKWSTEHLDAQVATIRTAAAARSNDLDDVELNALVQVVEIVDDTAQAQAATEALLERVADLTPEQATAIPYVLIGTVDDIVAKLRACRDRWGISYFAVRELEGFAPVIAGLR